MATRSCAKTKNLELKKKHQNPNLPDEIKNEINLKLSVRKPTLISDLSISPGINEREFWEQVIAEVDHFMLCRKVPEIKIMNHTDVLPPIHKARIKKIMPYEFSDTDDRIYFKDVLRPKKKRIYRHLQHTQLTKEEYKEEPFKDNALPDPHQPIIEENFNESEYSYILHKERDFNAFHLRIDKPPKHEPHIDQSWMSKYLSQTNKQRIIWKTKAYRKNPELMKKDFAEQGEELENIIATRFHDWLNTIGSTEKCDLTVSELKDLFDFKIDHMLVYSLNVTGKERKAVPKSVAKIWNMTDVSIEQQYEQFLNSRRRTKPRLISAFGRTIPQENREWIRHLTDHRLKPAFPEEIMTQQRMFRGILDAQSIPPLVRYYLKHPKLKRPEYLVSSGAMNVKFDRKRGKKITESGRLGKNTFYGKLGLDYLSCEYSK